MENAKKIVVPVAYEEAVTQQIGRRGDCSRGDAQGILECRQQLFAQCFIRSLDAEHASDLILNAKADR